MSLITLTDARASVRAAHGDVERIKRDLNAARAAKDALQERLSEAEDRLSKAEATLLKIAIHGEEEAA